METTKQRSEMSREYQWKLEDLYADNAAWEADYAKVEELTAAAASFEGKMGTADGLLAALKANEAALYLAEKLYTFARMRQDEDNGNTESQARYGRAVSQIVKLDAATAYFTPELLSLGKEKVEGFFAEQPALEIYRRTIESELRMEKYTLSHKEEALLAQMGELTGAPDNIYSMLTDADFVFGMTHDEQGKEVPLTMGRFVPLEESRNREVRREAYEKMYAKYREFTNTIAATYTASVKTDLFFAKARGYDSARQRSLYASEIPENVYDALVEAVHRHLPAMHRYLALRKKQLKVETLHFYDIYAPIVPEVEMGVPYEEACKTVLEMLAPLGKQYQEDLKSAFTQGWIDVYENQGKTSGAYSWGMYGTHPYVLLNYSNTLDNLFTLAHELGHSMHTFYSNQNQTFPNSSYPLFLAEIASTTNEAIVLHGLKQKLTRKEQLMALCNYQLDQIRGTVYRQTLFAEFEHKVHTMAEQGEALTAESMTAVYRELNEQYYKGMEIDDNIASEWMRIPHFYRAFYVYQYATGYSAAVAFSRRVLSGDEIMRQQYLGFLSAGCSKPALDILRQAGVDMEKPEPVEECLKSFEETLTQLENLLEE